jgi:glucan biosynthesis protein C
VDFPFSAIYNNVKNNCKGGKNMRKLYIDNIRWITVVLVVLYHVIKKRTGKLLVPSTLGLLVFWWILGYYNLLIGGGLEQMAAVPKPVLFIIMAVSGIGPLWYIQMLWIFSVLLVWVRRAEKDRLWKLGEKADIPFLVLFAIVIWGTAQILNTPMVVVYRFGIYGAGFFVGYFVLSHDEVMDRLEKCWLPLAVCAVILAAAFTVLYWGRPYAEHSVLDTPLCSLFAWFAVIAALAFMKKWGDISNTLTRWMAAKSWGLYLFHYLFIAMTAYYLNMYTKLPAVLLYLFVAAAGFAGAYLAYEIIRRIPVLRWIVCGIGGKKK